MYNCHPVLDISVQAEVSKDRDPGTGGTADTDDAGRRVVAGGHVLVRMDVESAYHLDCGGAFRVVFGGWDLVDFLAGAFRLRRGPRN